jgi:Tc toxin complex TcA C-terminal TcB-binding domain
MAKNAGNVMVRARQELYTWIIGQVSSVYYKAYKLASDTAKKAERCYGYELAREDTFISFGYWNSQKKGLMSDALLHDIKRMELAYLANNVREYELTKHVSLAALDPGVLLKLKSSGKVTITVGRRQGQVCRGPRQRLALRLQHRQHLLHRHQHRGVRLGPVRAELPRRALPAVRGSRSDQHLADRAADRVEAV